MKRSRLILGAAALVLLMQGTIVLADDGGGNSRMGKKEEQLKARFQKADANHDGKLTRDEAKGKMPRVYDHFDDIDIKHQGFVTLEDIEAYAIAQKTGRKTQ